MPECRSCHATIFWSETPGGRRAPFDPDGTNHFVTCPDRVAWRKPPEQRGLFDADEAPLKADDSRYPV